MCSRRQPVATHGNGFRLFPRFLGQCDLQPVVASCNHGAPYRLHILLSNLATIIVNCRLRFVRSRGAVYSGAPIAAYESLAQPALGAAGTGESGECVKSADSGGFKTEQQIVL